MFDRSHMSANKYHKLCLHHALLKENIKRIQIDNELEYFTVYIKFYLSVYHIYDNTKNANKLNVG